MILRNCSIDVFFSRCFDKKIVCYGIGAVFRNFINNYDRYLRGRKIAYLVDGNPAKIGETVLVGNQIYKIIGLEDLLAKNLSNLVFVISCGFFAEVVERLNAIPELEQAECYIYDFMLTQIEHEKICIRQKEKCLIPPIIHYCWFGKKEMPDLYKKWIDSWYKFCPEYDIIRWDEHNCDISENLFAKQAYEKEKYGFVPDYFRLKIIYEYGGIYLDTDVELLKNLDDLRYNEAYCGMERPGEVNLGLGFGAVAGHPVVKKMLERYQNMPFLKEDGTMDMTGSPIWQTMDLEDMGMLYGNRLQTVSGMTVYPIEVLSPKNVATGEMNCTEYTYSIHHYDASWIFGENSLERVKLWEDVQKIRSMFSE